MTQKRELPNLWVQIQNGADVVMASAREDDMDGGLEAFGCSVHRYIPASRIEDLRAWVEKAKPADSEALIIKQLISEIKAVLTKHSKADPS